MYIGGHFLEVKRSLFEQSVQKKIEMRYQHCIQAVEQGVGLRSGS